MLFTNKSAIISIGLFIKEGVTVLKKIIIAVVLVLSVVVAILANNYLDKQKATDEVLIEHWPVLEFNSHLKDIANNSLSTYKDQGRNYYIGLQDYNPFGDYLNYSQWKRWNVADNLIFDEDGVPKVKYGDEFFYNPVTISQYALTRYGDYLAGNEESLSDFIVAVDRLLDLQDDTGAFRYNFSWRYYLSNEIYEPGWVSGMAQGQSLSVLARAYHVTSDEKYLEAGNKAVEFLVLPVEEGGTLSTLEDLDPSLKDYIFFEEYISVPNNYTLNGYMFTLLGLYDWKVLSEEVQNDSIAGEYFELGIKTLINILPYYDIGGFSAYDLGHITFEKEPHVGVGYHAVHIYLLHALYSVTEEKWLKHFENMWRYYVE